MLRIRHLLSYFLGPKKSNSENISQVIPKSATMSNTGDLTSHTPMPTKPTTPHPRDHPAASLHEEVVSPLPADSKSIVQSFKVQVNDTYQGYAHGFLHLPPAGFSSRTAAILLSGAGGGVVGPSAMYLSLAQRLPLLSSGALPVLRLDYRYPARVGPCVADTEAAMSYLTSKHNIDKFVLVGWSFGGAPVFTLAGCDERIVGVATVASQTADALRGAREAGRRGVPVLLLHGTGDRVLSDRCSRNLHDAWLYGFKGDEGKEEARLVLFDGDDHALTKNATEAARLVGEFIVKCTGELVKEEDQVVLAAEISEDRNILKEAMVMGGDLRGKENLN